MPRSTINWRPLSVAALLFVAVFVIFLPCMWNDFTNFDDPVYVILNPHIHAGLTWSATRWAFTSFYAANWHPLTWISHILDFQMFGKSPAGNHLTSIVIHSASTALLFLLLAQTTGSLGRSLAVALLFGIHPLRVESVAWIAERKDVLNVFFSVLTLLAYVQWAKPKTDRPVYGWFCIALLFFALSLMAKAMSVTLPVLLLLFDYWPLQRRIDFRRALTEKVSFLLLAAASSLVTIAAQNSGGAIKAVVPLSARCLNAVLSIPRYSVKMAWPHDLAVYYPYPPSSLVAFLFALGCVGAISVAAILWRRELPWLFVGWWWFLISLIPVIGIVQIGTQAMADRYTYWPSIGLSITAVWMGGYLIEMVSISAKTAASIASAIILSLAALTERQITFWKGSETLFQHDLAVTRNNALAHLNLGVALADRGAKGDALFHFREAVRIAPTYPDVRVNLGIALSENGQISEAITQFVTAIQLNPDYAKAHANLAIAFQERNELERAIREYREALRLDPVSPDVRVGFGLALQQTGQLDAALAQFEEAIKEDPSYAVADSNRGIVLEKLGRLEEAVAAYRKALALDPKNNDAALNLPVVLFKIGKIDDAIAQARELIKKRPDYAEAYFNLGGILYSKNDFDEAIAAYEKALQLKPNYPDARHNLDLTLEGKSAVKR